MIDICVMSFRIGFKVGDRKNQWIKYVHTYVYKACMLSGVYIIR